MSTNFGTTITKMENSSFTVRKRNLPKIVKKEARSINGKRWRDNIKFIEFELDSLSVSAFNSMSLLLFNYRKVKKEKRRRKKVKNPRRKTKKKRKATTRKKVQSIFIIMKKNMAKNIIPNPIMIKRNRELLINACLVHNVYILCQ